MRFSSCYRYPSLTTLRHLRHSPRSLLPPKVQTRLSSAPIAPNSFVTVARTDKEHFYPQHHSQEAGSVGNQQHSTGSRGKATRNRNHTAPVRLPTLARFDLFRFSLRSIQFILSKSRLLWKRTVGDGHEQTDSTIRPFGRETLSMLPRRVVAISSPFPHHVSVHDTDRLQ